MAKRERDFDYDYSEIESDGVRIVFIGDEKTDVVRPTDIHMHSFWELFYVQSGKMTISTENEKYHLSDNEALIIPPKSYHNSTPEENTVKSLTVVNTSFYQGLENGMIAGLDIAIGDFVF